MVGFDTSDRHPTTPPCSIANRDSRGSSGMTIVRKNRTASFRNSTSSARDKTNWFACLASILSKVASARERPPFAPFVRPAGFPDCPGKNCTTIPSHNTLPSRHLNIINQNC